MKLMNDVDGCGLWRILKSVGVRCADPKARTRVRHQIQTPASAPPNGVVCLHEFPPGRDIVRSDDRGYRAHSQDPRNFPFRPLFSEEKYPTRLGSFGSISLIGNLGILAPGERLVPEGSLICSLDK